MEGKLEELSEIIKAILGINDALRKQAELRLTEIKQNPGELLVLLLEIMKSNLLQEDLRKFVAVLLMKYLKEGATNSENCLYIQVTPDIQALVRISLLEILKNELNPKVIKLLCSAISELAGTIIDLDSEWAELDQLVIAYITSNNDALMETGLMLLDTLLALDPTKFMNQRQQLIQLFNNCYTKSKMSIMVLTSECVCTLLTMIETPDVKYFVDFLLPIAKTIEWCYNENNEDHLQRLLICIGDVAEAEPQFFRKEFGAIFNMLILLSQKTDYDNEKLRHLPLEILICIMERQQKIAKSAQWLQLLCQALFDIMISIEEKIESEWLTPKEGYNTDEDLNPDDNVNFGKMSMDRLMSSLGEEIMLPIIKTILQKGIAQNDWRCKHAALMAVSQVGEYVYEVETLTPIVPILVTHLAHPNPRVRFACLHALGQISDDMSPEFEENFHEQLLLPMISALDDMVPRVVAHAAAALTNFVEHISPQVYDQVGAVLLPKLIHLIRTGISIVKENAMACMSSTAEAAGEKFQAYYDELMPFLSECLRTFVQSEYKQFRGQTIECITMIGSSVGKEMFKKHVTDIIQYLINIQDNELSKNDPLRVYLMSAWQRICMILGDDFVPFLDALHPSFLKMAASIPGMSVASGNQKVEEIEDLLKYVSGEPEQTEITTTEIEEKEIAIQMIAVFAVELGGNYARFVEEASGMILPTLLFTANSLIRKSGATTLPPLTKCLRDAQVPRENLVNAGALYLQALWGALDRETNTEVRVQQVLSIRSIINKLATFMTLEELNITGGRIIKLIDAATRRMEKRKIKDEEEEEEEEVGEGDGEEIMVSAEEDAKEEELIIALSYLVGTIFKTHPDLSLGLAEEMTSKYVGGYLLPTSTENQKKFGLFMMDDMTEFLGAGRLGAHFSSIAQTIMSFSEDKCHALRQASLYGMGMLAKSGGDQFLPISGMCVERVLKGISHPMDKKHPNTWGHARDNAISSLGRILKYQEAVVPFNDLVLKFMNYLPLSYDKKEGCIAHDTFLDFVIGKGQIIIGANYENTEKIIKILGSIAKTSMAKEETNGKIAQLIKEMNAHEAISPLVQQAAAGLKQDQQDRLKQLINK